MNFYTQVYPRMREIALDAVKANYLRLDPDNLQDNF